MPHQTRKRGAKRKPTIKQAMALKIKSWQKTVKAVRGLFGEACLLLAVVVAVPNVVGLHNRTVSGPPKQLPSVPAVEVVLGSASYRSNDGSASYGSNHAPLQPVPSSAILHIRAEAEVLTGDRFIAQMVTWNGIEVWRGSAERDGGSISAIVPPLRTPGVMFYRLYARNTDGSAGELEQEFRIVARTEEHPAETASEF